MKRLLDIAVIATLALAGALLVGCAQNIKMPAEDTGTWLHIERRATLPGGHRVYVACDTVNGNLLYLMTGNGEAIATVVGGCK